MNSIVEMSLACLNAGVFGFAAAAKASDRRAFTEYLEPIAGRHAGRLAGGTLGAEIALAVIFVAGIISGTALAVASAAAIAFVFIVTAGYAAMLVLGQRSACNCFGRLKRGDEQQPRVWEPAVLAARNAAIVGVSALLIELPLGLAISMVVVVPTLTAASLVLSTIRLRGQVTARPAPALELDVHSAGSAKA